MTRENTRNNSTTSLFKCLLLVLVFGVVAMPPVGFFLTVTRRGIVGKVLGGILLVVGIAAWASVIYYSIR